MLYSLFREACYEAERKSVRGGLPQAWYPALPDTFYHYKKGPAKAVSLRKIPLAAGNRKEQATGKSPIPGARLYRGDDLCLPIMQEL